MSKKETITNSRVIAIMWWRELTLREKKNLSESSDLLQGTPRGPESLTGSEIEKLHQNR